MARRLKVRMRFSKLIGEWRHAKNAATYPSRCARRVDGLMNMARIVGEMQCLAKTSGDREVKDTAGMYYDSVSEAIEGFEADCFVKGR